MFGPGLAPLTPLCVHKPTCLIASVTRPDSGHHGGGSGSGSGGGSPQPLLFAGSQNEQKQITAMTKPVRAT